MIHICYVISSLCNEGPTNVMYNIIKYLDFKVFKISIITLMPEKENTRFDDFKLFPVDIYQINSVGSLTLWSIFKSFKARLLDISPDILHAHCARSLYLMCLMPHEYKRVYTIHIFPGYQHVKTLGPLKGKIIAQLNHIFTRLCDLPIGCAESVGWQYKEKKGWSIKCIPNGSSSSIWKYDIDEKIKLREELGLDQNMRYFIFIGRFSPEKNPEFLADVFKGINISDVGLIMLGDGCLWNKIHGKISKNIIMPGFTTKVLDYIKASDFYISTSDVEGLANTVLESMSVGLPMILSNIPSHIEVMSNFLDNTVGFLINQHDAMDVREKIKSILDLDVKSASEMIKTIYKRKYTAEAMSKAYQNEYVEIVK